MSGYPIDQNAHDAAIGIWAVESSLRLMIAACTTQGNEDVASHIELALPLLADRLRDLGTLVNEKNWQNRGEEAPAPENVPAPTKKKRTTNRRT